MKVEVEKENESSSVSVEEEVAVAQKRKHQKSWRSEKRRKSSLSKHENCICVHENDLAMLDGNFCN
jgi:hypothetical protein